MPITLELDKLENAQLEETASGIRIVRTGIAKGIDTSTASRVLLRVLTDAGLPSIGASFPDRADALLRRRRVFPAASDSIARIELEYETPSLEQPSGGGTEFVIRDATGLSSESRQLADDGTPLDVIYTPSGGTAIPKPATLSKLVPLRTIIASGYIIGQPDDAMRNAIGCVNASPWKGLGPGYWLCNGFDSSTSDAGNSYSLSVSFISKVHQNWMAYAIFVNDEGKRPSDVVANDIKAKVAEVYDEKVDTTVNGFLAWGAYAARDFNNIFSGI